NFASSSHASSTSRPSMSSPRAADPIHDMMANINELESALSGSHPTSTYALLHAAARRFGDAPALTFIRDATDIHSVERWSFRQLLAKVTQAANLFGAVSIGPKDVVAYALPNLPETHFALWGAETAGIAMAINPALSAEQASELLSSANVRVLVTMAPSGAADFLPTLAPHLDRCPSLTHVFVVGDGSVPALGVRTVMDFGRALQNQRGDALESGRQIDSDDASS